MLLNQSKSALLIGMPVLKADWSENNGLYQDRQAHTLTICDKSQIKSCHFLPHFVLFNQIERTSTSSYLKNNFGLVAYEVPLTFLVTHNNKAQGQNFEKHIIIWLLTTILHLKGILIPLKGRRFSYTDNVLKEELILNLILHIFPSLSSR